MLILSPVSVASFTTSTQCHVRWDTRTHLHDIHTCPPPTPPSEHTTVMQHASETRESNVSLCDEQKVKAGGRGGAQMHNLSKSHPKPYLFTDFFNKVRKMQTNEFARGCKCVLRSSLTRPHLLQPSTAAIHHALLRKMESALSSNNASKRFIYLFLKLFRH